MFTKMADTHIQWIKIHIGTAAPFLPVNMCHPFDMFIHILMLSGCFNYSKNYGICGTFNLAVW